MSIRFQCPACETSHSLNQRALGRRIRCPNCNALVELTPDGPPILICEPAPSPVESTPPAEKPAPGQISGAKKPPEAADAQSPPPAKPSPPSAREAALKSMATLAKKVLDLAEVQGLLDGKAITDLRRQVAESKFIVTPEAIAKVLVDHGHLTPFQARKLVNQALGPEPEPVSPPAEPAPTRARSSVTEELTLAEDDDEPSYASADEDEDEIVELEPVQPATTPQPRPFKKTSSGAEDLAVLEPVVELTPLDDLFPADPLRGAARAAPLAGPLAAGAAGRPAVAKNVWDSPLLLVGGGLLGVLLVVFGLLLFSLTRGSAAQLFNKAEEEYRGGAYASAIAGFERFLERYPNNPDASLARVRRGMAQLRQVADDGKNPRLALQTARQVLPQIENESKFNEARIELSAILPDIADGFASRAGLAQETARKEELVKLTAEALELVNNPSYLPASLRKDREQRIADVLDKLQVAQRGIQQEKDLATAIETIHAATDQGNAAEAYRVRSQLLRTYPGLETNAQLQIATRQIGEKERQLVQVSEPGTGAATADPPAASSTVVIAPREGPPAPAKAAPVYVLVEGAVYGLDAACGRVLWRRFVGYETTTPPVAILRGATNDALLVDARTHELLRVRGADGQLVWRQSLGGPFSGPVLAADRVLVTTRKGRIVHLDAGDGKIVRAAQLPQGAAVAVALAANQGQPQPRQLLQLGEHSTLFVLDADSLTCSETVYLGHKAGAIFVPPVAVRDHVLVCESPADDFSLIRVLGPDAKTKGLTTIGRPFRLKGRIVTPLAVSGRRMAAITDLGQIAVYEIDSASPQEPVRQIVGVEASETMPLAPYYLLDGNRLWLATRRRVLMEVQAALQQLNRKWAENQGDTFIAPLQLLSQNNALLYARRRPGSPAVLVEACDPSDGKPLWTTHLAAPIAGLAVSESNRAVDVLTAEAKLYSLTSEQLRAGSVERPTFSPPPGSGPAILRDAVLSTDGNTLIWTEAQAGGRVFSYNVTSRAAPVATPLPSSSAEAAAPAQILASRLLVPLKNGSVVLLEQGSGNQAVQAFVPALQPGSLPLWTRPAVLANDSGFLISDGRGSVYSVVVKEQPQPHLEVTAETKTDVPLVSPLVLAGGSAFGVLRSTSGDALAGFDAQGSPAFAPVPLVGRVQAGPFAVGGLALVAAEPDGLLCFESGGKPRWQQPLSYGPLAGPPLACPDGDLLVIYQSGVVLRVDSTTGQELAKADVGQPLGGAARILGQEVFLAGSDGVLHRIPLPPRP